MTTEQRTVRVARVARLDVVDGEIAILVSNRLCAIKRTEDVGFGNEVVWPAKPHQFIDGRGCQRDMPRVLRPTCKKCVLRKTG